MGRGPNEGGLWSPECVEREGQGAGEGSKEESCQSDESEIKGRCRKKGGIKRGKLVETGVS